MIKPLLRRALGSFPLNALLRAGRPLWATLVPQWARRLPWQGPLEITLPGGGQARFNSDGDDAVLNEVAWLGWRRYESGTLPLALELGSRGTVIDVGSHSGLYAVLWGVANSERPVIACEPVPEFAGLIARHAADNRLGSLTVHEAACGCETGTVSLYLPEGVTLSRPTSPSLTNRASGSSRELQVPLVRLDDLALDDVSLIKIDVEGHEPDVLEGARNLLISQRPAVIAEVLPGESGPRLEGFLSSLGYVGRRIENGRAVERGPVTGDPDYRHPNWLFVHASWKETTLPG